MSDLEKRAWEIYRESLSREELADEQLCKELRKTLVYAKIRVRVAWSNLINEIVSSLPLNRWLK